MGHHRHSHRVCYGLLDVSCIQKADRRYLHGRAIGSLPRNQFHASGLLNLFPFVSANSKPGGRPGEPVKKHRMLGPVDQRFLYDFLCHLSLIIRNMPCYEIRRTKIICKLSRHVPRAEGIHRRSLKVRDFMPEIRKYLFRRPGLCRGPHGVACACADQPAKYSVIHLSASSFSSLSYLPI